MPLLSPCQGCQVFPVFEKVDKMADIGDPAGEGNGVYGSVGIFELFLRVGDAGIYQVILQGDTQIMLKFPGEIVFADMLFFRQKGQGKFLLKMSVNIFHTSADMIREHGIIVQSGGMEQQKFRQQAEDQVGGQKFAGNQFFLIDTDDLPEHVLKMGFIPNIEDFKAVSLELLIIADGRGTIKMNPEKFPLFSGGCRIVVMVHAVDKKTLPF